MNISKYINVPQLEGGRRPPRYLSRIQLLISLLTGILLICLTLINSFTMLHSKFEVLSMFSLMILFKALICINYLSRRKASRTHLSQMATIKYMDLLVPAFLKSILYIGLMAVLPYQNESIVFIFIFFTVIGVEVITICQARSVHDFHPTSSPEQRKRKFVMPKAAVSIRDLLICVLLLVGWALNVHNFTQFGQSIETIIFGTVGGAACLIAFYYLHGRAFLLYQSDVDEMLAKQYPIEVLNILIIVLIVRFSVPSASSSAEEGGHKGGFFFILEYPIHTLITIIVSLLYEYLCFEMLKKASFKYLFLSQLTGLFWRNVYLMVNSNFSLKLYFSTFACAVSLVILMRLFEVDSLMRKVHRALEFVRKSFRRRGRAELQEESQVDSHIGRGAIGRRRKELVEF